MLISFAFVALFLFLLWLICLFASFLREDKKEITKKQKENILELDYSCPFSDHSSWEDNFPLEEKKKLLEKLKNFDFSAVAPLENCPFVVKPKERVFFKFQNVGADFIRGKNGAIAQTEGTHYGTVYITNKRYVFVGNIKVQFDAPIKGGWRPEENTSSFMMFLRNTSVYFYFENKKILFDFFFCSLFCQKMSLEDREELLKEVLEIEE